MVLNLKVTIITFVRHVMLHVLGRRGLHFRLAYRQCPPGAQITPRFFSFSALTFGKGCCIVVMGSKRERDRLTVGILGESTANRLRSIGRLHGSILSSSLSAPALTFYCRSLNQPPAGQVNQRHCEPPSHYSMPPFLCLMHLPRGPTLVTRKTKVPRST